MHKYILLFFCGWGFLTACGSKKTPDDVIPEPVMTRLLTDIHVTDGSLYAIDQHPDSLYKYGTGRYFSIFKEYHTTGKNFQASLKYYTTRPDIIQRIYEQVAVNIQIKIDSLNNINAPKTKNAIPTK